MEDDLYASSSTTTYGINVIKIRIALGTFDGGYYGSNTIFRSMIYSPIIQQIEK